MEDSAQSASAPADPRANGQDVTAVGVGTPPGAKRRDGSRLTRWFRRPWPKRVRVAAAGYAIVVVFSIAAGVARAVGTSAGSALVVGILAAAPLIIALIGERITGIKAFAVEISLAEVTVPIEGDFSGAVMTTAEMFGSAAPDLLASIGPAMQNRSKLIRINLRDDDYWWSTRIFLVAALAGDYTEVEALIFVRSGEDRIFVGIASPRAVRARLAAKFPGYEAAYRVVRAKSAAESADHGIEPDREVDEILKWRWRNAQDQPEDDIKVVVSTDDLREWLRGDLDTETLPYGPLTALLRYRINSRDRRYAALTDHLRLVAVVDRDELAIRSAAAELDARLDAHS